MEQAKRRMRRLYICEPFCFHDEDGGDEGRENSAYLSSLFDDTPVFFTILLVNGIENSEHLFDDTVHLLAILGSLALGGTEAPSFLFGRGADELALFHLVLSVLAVHLLRMLVARNIESLQILERVVLLHLVFCLLVAVRSVYETLQFFSRQLELLHLFVGCIALFDILPSYGPVLHNASIKWL